MRIMRQENEAFLRLISGYSVKRFQTIILHTSERNILRILEVYLNILNQFVSDSFQFCSLLDDRWKFIKNSSQRFFFITTRCSSTGPWITQLFHSKKSFSETRHKGRSIGVVQWRVALWQLGAKNNSSFPRARKAYHCMPFEKHKWKRVKASLHQQSCYSESNRSISGAWARIVWLGVPSSSDEKDDEWSNSYDESLSASATLQWTVATNRAYQNQVLWRMAFEVQELMGFEGFVGT